MPRCRASVENWWRGTPVSHYCNLPVKQSIHNRWITTLQLWNTAVIVSIFRTLFSIDIKECYFRIFSLIDNRMGIKLLLIDSRFQGVWTVWYGHTKTGPDRRRDREDGASTGHAHGCRVRDASLQQHVQWFNDCCSSKRVGWARWVVTPMTPWVVRPLQWCRSRYDWTADDW